MPTIQLHMDGDGCWPDIADGVKIHNVTGPIQMAALTKGMQSGDPSISIRVDLANGSVVIAETSLRLLLTAADAFKARHGDPRR